MPAVQVFTKPVKVKVPQSCQTFCDPMDYTVAFSRPEYWSG